MTLLPVISKIFCSTLLQTRNFERSRLGLDEREVQLNRGCKDIQNRLQEARGTETRQGVRSQRNRKENQDAPIQDFSSTGPAIWL